MTDQTLEHIKESVTNPDDAAQPAAPQRPVEKFDIDEDNLSIRRGFIRLDEDDRQICEKLTGWVEDHASKIARDYYDWLFTFPRTVSLFESHCEANGITPVHFRVELEKQRKKYLIECFKGAETNWSVDYANTRQQCDHP